MSLAWRAIGLVRGLWRREQGDRELEAELRDFLERAADDRVSAGATRDEATRAARAAFGGVDVVKESVREAGLEAVAESVWQDWRYAVRSLRRTPAFTAVAVLTLAIGIGANTAFFSLVNTVLLRPLPFPAAERLVALMTITPRGSGPSASPAKLNAWRRETALFEQVAGYQFGSVNVVGRDGPAHVVSATVSTGFFALLGATTSLGRPFSSLEDRPGAGKVVVLGHGFWLRQFGGDPAAVGQALRINGENHTVVGVLAPTVQTVDLTPIAPDVWTPLAVDADNETQAGYFFSIARLRDGVSLEQANARLALVANEFKQQFPTALGAAVAFGVQPLQGLIVRDVRQSLLVLYGAVATVLLIACVNIGNLMLVRMSGRQAELAMRRALGASRGRIVRQLLTEGVVLSAAGGAAGLLVGALILPGLFALVAGQVPRLSAAVNPGLDWRALLATAITCLATSVVLGVVPALHAGRRPGRSPLADGRSRTDNRSTLQMRGALVVAEVALAVVLLIGAVLLLRTFAALRDVDPGFDRTHLLSLRTSLSEPGSTTAASLTRIVDDGLERMSGQAGVVSAAASLCCMPLENQGFLPVVLPGRPLDGPYHIMSGWWVVTPAYFDALKIPVVRGRAFTRADDGGAAGVVIINQAMARRFWPDADPLDQPLLVGRGYLPGNVTPRRIVGIVGDVRDAALSREAIPTTYVPMKQLDDQQLALTLNVAPVVWIARTSAEPRLLENVLSREIETGTGRPVARVRTMDDIVSASTARADLSTVLMTGFGIAALVLAAIGIYGVTAYGVAQRRREFGVRLALGASSSQLRHLVLRQGLKVTALGVALGVVGAAATTRVLSSLLFSVAPRDPWVFVTAAAALSVVALVATALPAARASRQDIGVMLRQE